MISKQLYFQTADTRLQMGVYYIMMILNIQQFVVVGIASGSKPYKITEICDT